MREDLEWKRCGSGIGFHDSSTMGSFGELDSLVIAGNSLEERKRERRCGGVRVGGWYLR